MYIALHGELGCLNTLLARGARLDLSDGVRPAIAARPPHAPPHLPHRRAAADD